MITLEQHLNANAAAIEAEAQEYARSYGCSLDVARREVADEYHQGYCEGEEAVRNGDWNYGQE